MNRLDAILRYKREELESLRRSRPLADVKSMARDAEVPRPFLKMFLGSQPTRIIAEMKKASPSAGVIAADYRPSRLAGQYEEGGAAALSVLTDKKFFQGELRHIAEAKLASRLPVLRKDFTLDEYHIWEARAFGADAVLLIVGCLEPTQIADYLALTAEIGMLALVEVHREEELVRAGRSGAALIGINNRDLKTFEVDLDTTRRLVEKVPEGVTVISESGIKTRGDIEELEKRGVMGFLIGETLLRVKDPREELMELRGVPPPLGGG